MLSCFAQHCFAQSYYPIVGLSLSAQVIKASKIKFREDYVYNYTDGKLSVLGNKIKFERFDTLGQKVEEVKFDEKGNSIFEVTYTYDNYGRELQCIGHKNKDMFYRRWDYSFNEATKSLEKTVYNNVFNLEKWIYRFDSLGNIVEETSYNADGEFNYRYLM